MLLPSPFLCCKRLKLIISSSVVSMVFQYHAAFTLKKVNGLICRSLCSPYLFFAADLKALSLPPSALCYYHPLL